MAFHIIGTGSALPEQRITNDDLSRFLDTTDEWIFSRTGIRERRVCTHETLDDLAVAASERALAAAGLAATDLDLIVCATTSGDHLMPAEACAVAERIGASCPAFDVSAACAGFVFALDVVDGYLARGRARRVLVVAAEQMSRLVDWTDRATCVLFGDGAAACVVEAGGASPLAIELSTTPDTDAVSVPGIAGTSPFAEATRVPSALAMKGRRVFKFGVHAICDAVHGLCAEAGIGVADIDHFVFHQANDRILTAAVQRLGIDDARVARTLPRPATSRAPASRSPSTRSRAAGGSTAASSSPSSASGPASTWARACSAGNSPAITPPPSPIPREDDSKRRTIMADTTFDRICDIIRDNAGTGAELTPETKLADAGLDSLATVEAVIACEDEFGIEIDTDSNPETVGELVELIESLLEN